MKRHKVLIATYYWPPSGGPGVQRYLKFAKYLPRFQVDPVILTVKNPTYPVRDTTLEKEVPAEVPVYRTRTFEPFGFYAGLSGKSAESVKPTDELKGVSVRSRIGSWIRANLFIPDARAGWLLTAKSEALKIIRKEGISVIITTGPPHSVHFIGKHIQQKTGIRWLADFRDPWSQVYYNQILPRTAAAEHMDRNLEKSVLEQADEVIVVSRSQAESFRKIVERGYRVITNGFDPEDFDSLGKQTEEAAPREFLIRHVGTIGEAAVPVALLRAIRDNRDHLPLRLEFIGDVHPVLPRMVEEMGLAGVVVFSAYLPHRQALEKMCSADALLLIIPDVPDIRHHIPGKLFEYLGSGRPLLVLGPVDGDTADIVEKQKAGLTCNFWDHAAIGEALSRFTQGLWKTALPADLRDHPFSRENLTRELSKLIS